MASDRVGLLPATMVAAIATMAVLSVGLKACADSEQRRSFLEFCDRAGDRYHYQKAKFGWPECFRYGVRGSDTRSRVSCEPLSQITSRFRFSGDGIPFGDVCVLGDGSLVRDHDVIPRRRS